MQKQKISNLNAPKTEGNRARLSNQNNSWVQPRKTNHKLNNLCSNNR